MRFIPTYSIVGNERRLLMRTEWRRNIGVFPKERIERFFAWAGGIHARDGA